MEEIRQRVVIRFPVVLKFLKDDLGTQVWGLDKINIFKGNEVSLVHIL